MTKRQVKSTIPSELRDEWETNKFLFQRLHDEFRFVGDIAASDKNFLISKYYTKEDDALTKDWVADFYPQYLKSPWKWEQVAVFLNPPFSLSGPFLTKANEEAQRGLTVVCLVRGGAPETEWWTKATQRPIPPPSTGLLGNWHEPKHEIRYLKPRVQFTLPDGYKIKHGVDFPSALIIMRPHAVSVAYWWEWMV